MRRSAWVFAAIALFSIPLAWLYIPTSAYTDRLEQAELARIETEEDLLSFESHARSSENLTVARARYAQLVVVRFETKGRLTIPELADANEQLTLAVEGGFPKEKGETIFYRLARAAVSHGFAAEGVRLYRDALTRFKIKGAPLVRLARMQVSAGSEVPGARETVEQVFRENPSIGALLKYELLWANRATAELQIDFEQNREKLKDTPEYPLMLIEYAKTLNQVDRARQALEEARIAQPELAVITLAEILRKHGEASGARMVEAIVAGGSSHRYAARVVLGEFEIARMPQVGLEHIKLGLVKSSPEDLERVGVDREELRTSIEKLVTPQQSAEALEAAGGVLHRLGSAESAALSCRMAARSFASHREKEFRRRALRNYTTAASWLEQAAHGSALLLAQAAKDFMNGGQYEKAADLYDRLLEGQDEADWRYRLIYCLDRAGDLDRALRAVDELQAKLSLNDPLRHDVGLERSRILHRLGKNREALKALEEIQAWPDEAVAAEPDRSIGAEILFLQASSALELYAETRNIDIRNQAARALEDYRTRYLMKPTNFRLAAMEVAVMSARLALEEQDLDGAQAFLREAQTRATWDERDSKRTALLLWGDVLMLQSRFAEAFQAYERASDEDAGVRVQVWSRLGRARVLTQLGRVQDAHEVARTARRLMAEDPLPFAKDTLWMRELGRLP